MEYFSYIYKFYDIVDNQIKNRKIFSLLSKFKYSGFEFANPKRTTVFRTVIEGERKNIKYSLEWEQKDFDFDVHWNDLKALFIFLIRVQIGLCQINFTLRDYILRTMNI